MHCTPCVLTTSDTRRQLHATRFSPSPERRCSTLALGVGAIGVPPLTRNDLLAERWPASTLGADWQAIGLWEIFDGQLALNAKRMGSTHLCSEQARRPCAGSNES